jgi:tetratricopeptide (TPR) repeat protein
MRVARHGPAPVGAENSEGERTGAGIPSGAVTSSTDDIEQRLAAAWIAIDSYEEGELRAVIDALVADAPPAIADFERASAWDSTGHPDEAVPLYRSALSTGLTGLRRRRATIQLASSLRNLGAADEAIALLSAELAAAVEGEAAELDDAVRAFLALALVEVGRSREAAALALEALAPHLPRYQRALGAYARAL